MATNKPDFESRYGAPFRAVHRRWGSKIPPKPVSHWVEPTVVPQPLAYLNVQVDGRETSYFEWLGAGIYSVDLHSSIHHARPHFLHELHFGFDERFFYLRLDAFPEMWPKLRDCEFRIALCGGNDLRLMVVIEQGNFAGCLLDTEEVCILGLHELVQVAFGRILEVGISRRLIALKDQTSFSLEAAVWRGGLPVDVLPREGSLDVRLGTDAFAWPAQ